VGSLKAGQFVTGWRDQRDGERAPVVCLPSVALLRVQSPYNELNGINIEGGDVMDVTGRAGIMGEDIRSDIELLAGKLERLGVVDRLMFCLTGADTPSRLDAGLWRAAIPYLGAALLSVYGDGPDALEAVFDVIDGAFIWDKISGGLPDVTDDAAGVAIGERLIERFLEFAGMSKAE